MLSGCPVGENWIISCSSDREASGACHAVAGYAGHGSPLAPGRGTRAGHGHREGRRSGRKCDRWPGSAVTIRPAGSSFPGRAAAEAGPRRAAEGPGMSETADGAKIVQAYRDHRPYLIGLAFRMLGDIGAAEDAVQDAFT